VKEIKKMKNAMQLSIGISSQDLIKAIKKMPKREREGFIEDLIAATSPEYLESIREARRDYKDGHIVVE